MNALTVLAKIKPGHNQGLEHTLTRIQEHPDDNGLILVGQDNLTHCARWMITFHDDQGYRLLLLTEYDGGLSDYISHLVRISPGLDEIWGHCEGYTDAAHFEQFIRANRYETQAFYIGFRDETVQSIRNKIAVRKILENLLDQALPGASPWLEVLNRLPPAQGLSPSLSRTWRHARATFHYWWVGMLLRIIMPITQLGQTRNFPKVPSLTDIESRRKLSRLNGQMTTITEVKPGRFPRLRLAFAANEFLGKYGYAPGQFANVGTLHSFRWVLIDGGKRVIFVSVFDGSWENYMGDFIDKIIWALDGVYNNTKDYPPGGMRQVNEFQTWILQRQYPPLLFYKAYPEETVLNLVRDRAISEGLAKRLWSAANIDSENTGALLKTL